MIYYFKKGKPLPDGIVSPTNLTSNTSNPEWELLSDSVFSSSYPMYKAFDGKPGGYLDGWLSAEVSGDHWLGIRHVGSPVRVTAYGFYPAWSEGNDAPKTWEFQGSHNGSEWVTLDSQADVSVPMESKEYKYTLDSPAEYEYYRLYVTANQGGHTYLAIGEFVLYGGLTYPTSSGFTASGKAIGYRSAADAGCVRFIRMPSRGWLVYDAGTRVATISERNYTKVSNGMAVVGWAVSSKYSYPMLVGKSSEAVDVDQGGSGETNPSFQYNGETWYYSTDTYGMNGQPTPTFIYGNGPHLTASTSDMTACAKELLDLYFAYATYFPDDRTALESKEPVFYAPFAVESSTAETGQAFTVTGTPVYEIKAGVPCVSFDGTNYMTFPDTGMPSGTSARTLSCWFYCDSLATYTNPILFGYGTRAATQFCGLFIQSDLSISFSGYSSANNLNTDANVVSVGKWHHLLATKSGTEENIYVDGVLVKSGTSGKNTVLGTGQIADTTDEDTYRFDGSLAGCRIFNRVLSAEEIAELATEFTPVEEPEGGGSGSDSGKTYVYTVSGAGTDSANGDYWDSGETFSGGNPVYTNGVCEMYFDGAGYSGITDIAGYRGEAEALYYGTGFTNSWWVNAPMGKEPAPTVTEYSEKCMSCGTTENLNWVCPECGSLECDNCTDNGMVRACLNGECSGDLVQR